MRRLLGSIVVLVLVVAARSAVAAPRGCVDLLYDCTFGSQILNTICGLGVHTLSSGDSHAISGVVFGPGVGAVTLTKCSNNATQVILGDTILCSLGDGSTNDNVCQIEIAARAPAPSMTYAGLLILGLALMSAGVWRQRRTRSM